MRIVPWLASALVAVFVALSVAAADPDPAPVEVRLVDGTVLKGQVTATSATDITLRTDYGVLRLPADRLAPESRRALLKPPDPAACAGRVRDLEAQVTELEAENQQLRKRLAAAAAAPPPQSPQTLLSAPTSNQRAADGLSYTISSTGKRHNSNCRYYSVGRPCGPQDGVACKVCGG